MTILDTMAMITPFKYFIFQQAGIKNCDPKLRGHIRECEFKWETLDQAEKDRITERIQRLKYTYEEIGKALNELRWIRMITQPVDVIRSAMADGGYQGLIRRNFLFAHATCMQEYDSAYDDILPIEIGFVKFSLAEGISHRFQRFVHPGPVKITPDMRDFSKRTHGIPLDTAFRPMLPGDQSSRSQAMFKEMEAIMELLFDTLVVHPDRRTGEDAPHYLIFTSTDQLQLLRNAMQKLCKDSGYQLLDSIIAVERLVIADVAFLISAYSHFFDKWDINDCHEISISSFYDYTGMCAFHNKIDNNDCALGYPSRLCYIIADCFCRDAGIPMIEGRHYPARIRGPARDMEAEEVEDIYVDLWKEEIAKERASRSSEPEPEPEIEKPVEEQPDQQVPVLEAPDFIPLVHSSSFSDDDDLDEDWVYNGGEGDDSVFKPVESSELLEPVKSSEMLESEEMEADPPSDSQPDADEDNSDSELEREIARLQIQVKESDEEMEAEVRRLFSYLPENEE